MKKNNKKPINEYFSTYLIETTQDLYKFPLNKCFIGLNHKIYRTLASRHIEVGSDRYNQLRTVFSEEELELPLEVYLLEMGIHAENPDGEWDYFPLDFQATYDFLKDHESKYDRIRVGASPDDTTIWLPLSSNILKQSANYAHNWFERKKIDSLMDAVVLQDYLKFTSNLHN